MIARVPPSLVAPGMIVRVGSPGEMVFTDRGMVVDGGKLYLCCGVLLVVGSAPSVRIIAGGVHAVPLSHVSLPLDVPGNWDAACRWVWRTAGGSALAPGESAPRLRRLGHDWRMEIDGGDDVHDFRDVGVDGGAPVQVPGIDGVTDPCEALAMIVRVLS